MRRADFYDIITKADQAVNKIRKEATKVKKLLFILLMVVGVLGLTACNFDMEITIASDGSYTSKLEYYMCLEDFQLFMSMMPEDDVDPSSAAALSMLKSIDSDEKLLQMFKMSGSEVVTKTIDGKLYFTLPVDGDVMEMSGSAETGDGYVIASDTFELTVKNSEIMGSLFEMLSEKTGIDSSQMVDKLLSSVNGKLIVHMPSEIINTNGTLSADKKTATFVFSFADGDITLYAYAKKSNSNSSGINIDVADDGYTTKNSININTSDNIRSITVNGDEVDADKKVTVKKDGVYNITVVTESGEESFRITRDAKKPKVKGVSNGKTYTKTVKIKFSDATSGIKSATLNGKAIKSGKKVKSSGKYTLVVTDNAGNKKTVEFEIKK